MYIVFLFRILFQPSSLFRFLFFFIFIVNILIFYLFKFCMAEEPPRGSYRIKYVCMYVGLTANLLIQDKMKLITPKQTNL